jgi:hypothetical protein
VHHDLDLLERHPEEQVRLDDLQPLVDQRRGVDRDDGAHRPRRVRERVGDGDVRELLAGAPAEGATARGEHQPAYLVAGTAAQALRDRGVLGVDGHELAGAHA